METIKKGDFVRITKGSFKGWRGIAELKQKEGKYTYFSIFPRYKETKRGRIDPKLIGLGMIINVAKEDLKKVL
jgi:ribosomal protein L24